MSDRYIIRTTGQTGPVDTTAQTALAAHLADTSDAHDASAVSVLDLAGYYTGTDVEAVLAEQPAKFLRKSITSSANPNVIDASTLSVSGNKAVLKILRPEPTTAEWTTGALVNQHGGYFTNAWVVISGNMEEAADADGNYWPSIAGYPDTNKQSMLSVWSDVNSCAVEIRPAASSSGNRCLDILDTSANVRLAVEFTGQLSWGATTYSATDTFLSRQTAGQLWVTSAAAEDAQLTINAPTGKYAFINLAVAGTASFSMATAATTQTQLQQNSNTVARLYDTQRMSVGGVDLSPAVLSVISTSTSVPIARFRHTSGSYYDTLQISESTNASLHRFDYQGYSITAKTSAPADANLNAGELAYWFDSTNGASKAMFKGKSANGTVVTGSVTLS